MASALPLTKPCRNCRQPIDPKARKCPHCLGWQARWFPDPQSPRGLFLFVGMIFGIMIIMLGVLPRFFPHKELVTTGSVSVIDPSIHHSADGCGRWVTVVGKLSNSNDSAVWYPYFEVRFFNDQGELIDGLASSDSAIVGSSVGDLVAKRPR